jgi:autotransporter-associated beta strand protein
MKPKTTHTNRQIPRLAPAMAMGIETLQLMKTRLALLKLTIILCATFVTSVAFGQTLIWTNPVVVGPNGNNIGVTTNWSGGSPVGGSIWEFNGTVPGPMLVYQNDGIDHNPGNLVGGTAGGNGGTIYVNASQTSPVQLSTTASPASVNMGFNTFTVDPGAGQLTLGDNTANILATVGRPSGTTHDFINNSTNPVIICPNFEWQNGGGSAMVLEFDSPLATPGSGIGDYGITNNLNSGNSGTISLWFVSSGTITWSGPSIAPVNGTIASPVFLNAGTTLILKTNNLLTSQSIQNNAPLGFGACPLIYDGHAAQTLSGIIGNGTSPLISIQVKSGTLTLSGVNIFTGDVTISGGELVANQAETPGTSGALGVANTIHLTGGTLGWGLNSSADYSARFDTSAGQVYSFDTGGQNVTLGTALGSSGATLTKLGNGTLTLTGTSSYSGLTTVSAAELLFQGSKTGAGNITVNDGTTLGAFATGTQITPATLTLGQTASGVSLEFNNVNSTANAIIAAGTIASPAGSTVTINVKSGTFAVGNSYPLVSWTTGTAPGTKLGILNGWIGNVVTNISGKEIDLQITGTAYSWTGLNNNSWGSRHREQLEAKRRSGGVCQ